MDVEGGVEIEVRYRYGTLEIDVVGNLEKALTPSSYKPNRYSNTFLVRGNPNPYSHSIHLLCLSKFFSAFLNIAFTIRSPDLPPPIQ